MPKTYILNICLNLYRFITMYTQIRTYIYSCVLGYSYTCTHIHPQHIVNRGLHTVNLDAFFSVYIYIYIYIYTHTPWSTDISNYILRKVHCATTSNIHYKQSRIFFSFIWEKKSALLIWCNHVSMLGMSLFGILVLMSIHFHLSFQGLSSSDECTWCPEYVVASYEP